VKGLISTIVAILTGLIVLLGYFFKIPLLLEVRSWILDWAVILAAMAVFIGVINLFMVNQSRFRSKQKGGLYSLILIISLAVTLLIGLIFKLNHPVMIFIFNSIQLPVERSLMALLAITLLLASIRLLRRKISFFPVVFLATAVLILLGTAPLPFGELPFFSNMIRPLIAQVFAAAGARGILIGVALATLTTGLRILFAADRPYGGK